MKKFSLGTIVTCIFILVFIQSIYAYDIKNLESVKIDEFSRGDVYFYYKQNQCKILLKDISRTDYIKELIVAEIKMADVKVQLEYTSGPSEDPGFYIRTSNGEKRISSKMNGLNFAYVGDDSFYIWGHVNSYFNIRKKYVLKNNRVNEVMQPYYYVGLETKAKRKLVLFNTTDGKEQVDTIENGEELQIILNNGDWYLIKTYMGIVGWWRPENSEFYKSKEIGDLYYFGD